MSKITKVLARQVYDDFQNKKKQTLNEKLCAVRKVFDNYNLISGLHSFMSMENEKYKVILPPLSLLSDTEQKELIYKLKKLEFFPEKNIAVSSNSCIARPLVAWKNNESAFLVIF